MITTFKTKADAQKALNLYDHGTYYLAHGEYERPHYTIRKVRGQDAYYIHAKRYYFSGTFHARKSGGLTDYDLYY